MYSFITYSSISLGSCLRTQNALTAQQQNYGACSTVCQCLVYNFDLIDTVCISTTVPLSRFRRHQRPRPLFLTEAGQLACTATEEARDARFATIRYSVRISIVVGKVRAFTRQIDSIGFDNRFWNAQPLTHKQQWSMTPATPAHCPHTLATINCHRPRRMRPLSFRLKK